MTVARIDKAVIKGKLTRTPEGYLKGDAVIARTGILEYFENGRTVRELVLPDELSKADSLETLKMKPVTNGHPSVKMLDAKTVKQFQCGHTGESARVDGGLLVNSLVVTDAAAIADIENGKRELSAGYHCDLIEENGVWNGQAYDRIQTNRQYNHVAICDISRAGEVTTLRLDAADVYETGTPNFEENVTENASLNIQKEGCKMVKINLDGIEYDAAPEVQKHIEKLVAANSTVAAEHKVALDSVTADRDSFKDRFEKADAELKNVPAKIADAVKARIALVSQVTPHLDAAAVAGIADASDLDLKKAVVKVAFPKANLDSASEVYVQARFDAALEVLSDKTRTDAMTEQRRAIAGEGEEKADGCSKKDKTCEDAEKEVTTRWKKTSNRDAIMGKM